MLILENATLVDLHADQLNEGVHVAIEGDQIVAVSEHSIKDANADRLNLSKRCIMPGLIDAHFHATLTEVNPSKSKDLSPTLIIARAAPLLRNALLRGFTTVRDMCGADWGLQTATAEGTFLGPRLFIAGRGLSQTGGHGDLRSRSDQSIPCSCSQALGSSSVVADGVSGVQAAAREQLRQGVDHIKVFLSGGVVSPNDPLMSVQYTSEEISAIVQEARNWGSYVAAHAYTSTAITRAVIAGVRTIEHGNLLNPETASLMAEHSAFLVPTLITYEMMRRKGRELGLSEFSMEKLNAVLESGLRSVEMALAAGVSVGLGTDLLGELHAYQAEELLLRAKVQKPSQVLLSATEVNAEILGLAGKLGRIAPGAYADLIAMEGNPLRDLTLFQHQGEKIDLIVKAGIVIKQRL